MKRNESIDSAAGIMIIYMVFTHVCQHYHLDNSHFYMIMEHLLYFFMPWFFFKAGMFFKIGDNKEVVIKSTERLLKPFIIYSLLGHVCYCVVSFLKDGFHLSTLIPYRSLLMTGSIPGNLPLWFLLSLFACRVLLNMGRILGFSLYLIATIGLLVPLSLHVVGYVYPYYLANMMSGLFFMSMGAIIRDRKFTPPNMSYA